MAQVNIEVKVGGSQLDYATAELTDNALLFAIDAVCDACNYDPEMKDAEGIEVTKARYFSWMIRKYVEKQVERYAMKLGAKQAAEQAQVLMDTVVIPN